MTSIAQRKGISILMIMLVLYLPLHTSLVLGAGLTVESVTGGDGIEGFRKQNDQTTIVVRASLDDNMSVEPSHLTVTLSGLESSFSNCESTSSTQYRCTYTDFEPNSLQPMKHTYTITLSDGSETVGAVGATITVDNKGPIVDSFSIDTNSKTSAENATLSYRLKDPAYTPVVSGVGVASARITLNGEEIESFGGENDSMELSGDVDVTLGGEGNKKFCIEAEDLYGQRSEEECVSVSVDRTAPTATFVNLTHTDGYVFEWVTNQNYPALLSVRINGSDVDDSSVRGNLVGLSSRGTDINVFPTYCNEEEDAYLCVWNTFLFVNTTGSRSFSVSYADETGNSAEVTLSTYSINADVTGPRWIGIDTDFVDDDEVTISGNETSDILEDYRKYFTTRPDLVLGKDIPTLIYQFSEQGVGLNDTLIYADFSDLTGDSNNQAGNCSIGWNCYFYNLDFDTISVAQTSNATTHDDGSITIDFTSADTSEDYTAELGLVPQSSDDLGNFVEFDETFSVHVDVTPPIIEVVNITPVFVTGDFVPYVVVGDSYIVDVQLFDSSPIIVHYAAEDFGVNDSIAVCSSLGNSTQECSFTLLITEEGYYEGELGLTFIDYVGNSVEHAVTLPVYAIDEDVEPDYWKLSGVTCSPNSLDRTIIPLTNYKAYCSVQFVPSSGEASIRDMQFGNCQEKGFGNSGSTNGTGYMVQNDLLQIGTPNPILELVLGQFDASEVSALEFTCPIAIKSQRGNYLTRNYEYENVTVRLDMYDGLGTGELSEEVKDEIKDIYDDYVDNDGWELITTVEEFFDFSYKICYILGALKAVGELLANIGYLIRIPALVQFGIAIAVPATAPVVAPTAEVTSTTATTLESSGGQANKLWAGISNVLYKYCMFISCELYYGDNFAGKIQDGVNTYINKAVYLSLGSNGGGAADEDGKETDSQDEKSKSQDPNKKTDNTDTLNTKEFKKSNSPTSTTIEPALTPEDLETSPSFLHDGLIDPTPSEIVVASNYNDQAIENIGGMEFITGLATGEASEPQSAPKETSAPKKGTGKKVTEGLVDFYDGIGYLGNEANPKDSYILSIATLCIPGIIHNLNKYRQIQCLYADCLLSTTEGGIPVSICEDQKAYSECKFFWGPIFQLIPLSGFLDRISEIVKNVLANPLLLIDIVVDELLCDAFIGIEHINTRNLDVTFQGYLCILYSTVDLVLQLTKALEAADGDFFEYGGQDYCGNVEKGVKELGLD